MSLFELDTPEQKQKALMALYGLFIILPMSFISTLGGFFLTGNSSMAIAIGFSTILIIGGFMGYATVVINRAVQEVNIRVIEEKQ